MYFNICIFSSLGMTSLSKQVYHGNIENHYRYSKILRGMVKKTSVDFLFCKRFIAGLKAGFLYREAFRNLNLLTLPSLYIIEVVLYAKLNIQPSMSTYTKQD